VDVSTFLLFGGTGGFYPTAEISHMMQIALSAFSHIATYFLEGLTVKAVMPSEPSTPNKFKVA
jgi:hypothetical protein